MRNIFLFLFVGCIFICNSSRGQTKDEKEIADKVETLRKAMIAVDTNVLKQLTADKLSYGHSIGLIEDKAAFVNDLVTGKTAFVSITLSDQTISISGDAAIVRHRFVAELNNNHSPGTVDLMVLQVWQKQKGDWKLLARQAAKIPPQTN